MSCRVHVCHADDDSSVCKSGCFDPVHPIVAATASLKGQVSIFIIGKDPIFIMYSHLNDLLSAFTKSMVTMSLKSAPGVELFNPIAGIMRNIISGNGITMTQSPQMVMV